MDDMLVRALTDFLIEAKLVPDYEHARAHAEAFASGFAKRAPKFSLAVAPPVMTNAIAGPMTGRGVR